MSDTPEHPNPGDGDLAWAWARLGISPTTDLVEIDRAYGRAIKARMAADPEARNFIDLGEARVALEAALRGKPAPVTPPAADPNQLAAQLTQVLGSVMGMLPGGATPESGAPAAGADPQDVAARLFAAQKAMADRLAALRGAPNQETPPAVASGAQRPEDGPENREPASADPQQIFAQLLAAQQQAAQQLAASLATSPPPAHPAASHDPGQPQDAPPPVDPQVAAAQARAAQEEASRRIEALQAAPHRAQAEPGKAPDFELSPDTPLEDRAAAFVAAIQAHRAAGDISGAIARIDRLIATEPPASPLVEEIDLQLFRAVALQRTLSPALFNALVERFEWRDASGRIADEEPEAHATLLSRVDAEDWYASLLEAAREGDRVAGAAIARHAGPATPLRFDEAGQAQARSLIAQLWAHADFLLERFDARSLAALREAVEGAPLISGVAQENTRNRQRAARRVINRYPLRSKAAILCGFVVAIVVAVLGLRAVQGPTTGFADLSPQAQARRVIDETKSQWVGLRALDGSVLIYFSQVLACRPALKAIHYGVDRDTPDTEFPLPPDKGKWPQEIDMHAISYISAPATTKYVSVQLTYADGSTSEVRTYHIGDTP